MLHAARISLELLEALMVSPANQEEFSVMHPLRISVKCLTLCVLISRHFILPCGFFYITRLGRLFGAHSNFTDLQTSKLYLLEYLYEYNLLSYISLESTVDTDVRIYIQ